MEVIKSFTIDHTHLKPGIYVSRMDKGFIIMTGNYTVEDMRELTLSCLLWILNQKDVPATTPETCGNYLLHDLPMCDAPARLNTSQLHTAGFRIHPNPIL